VTNVVLTLLRNLVLRIRQQTNMKINFL